MAVTVTKLNTTITKLGKSGWVRVTYDTGAKDANENPVVLTATVTQASIEKSAGVLLPKAAIKAILEARLAEVQADSETDLATAL